jgi:hypothetical protein
MAHSLKKYLPRSMSRTGMSRLTRTHGIRLNSFVVNSIAYFKTLIICLRCCLRGAVVLTLSLFFRVILSDCNRWL